MFALNCDGDVNLVVLDVKHYSTDAIYPSYYLGRSVCF